MATTYTVLLTGGPCDGQTKQLTANQLNTHRTYCKGELYLLQTSLATIRHPWVFEYAKDLATKNQAPNPTHVTQAWTRWMRALAHTGPDAHNRIGKSTARINRIARHR